MLATVLLPQLTSQAQMNVATESLGPTRIHIKTADICYGKSKKNTCINELSCYFGFTGVFLNQYFVLIMQSLSSSVINQIYDTYLTN